MEKRLLPLFVLLLLCVSTVCGQNDYQYRPFETGAVWSVNNFKFGTYGDTVIGDKTYMKIYRQEDFQPFSYDQSLATYWGACRNDTAGKKVYFAIPAGVKVYDGRNNNFLYETVTDTELLFYDFSIALGDTITCHFFEEDEQHIIRTNVSRIDTGYINVLEYYITEGTYRKDFHFYNSDSIIQIGSGISRRIIVEDVYSYYGENFLWMEGIGSSSGFVSGSDAYLGVDGTYYHLLCYCDSNDECYHTGFDLSDNDSTDCFNRGTGGGVQDLEKTKLTVYPNPATNTLHVEFEGTDDPQGTFTITDITGVVVLTRECHEPVTQLDVSNLSPGLYVVSFRNAQGVVVRKFVKM